MPSGIPMPVNIPRDDVGQRAARMPQGHAAVDRLKVNVDRDGTSSRNDLEAATRRLPFHQLAPADQQKVREIANSPSLFRRLPQVTCQADRRVYDFFARHPDVAVSIWRAIGISEMQMRQTGPCEWETDLRDGTIGVVKLLHRSETSMLVLCEGEFKSPLLARPIYSTGLMHLEMHFGTDAAGQQTVTHSGDLFVVLHSDAVEAVAKLISPMSFKMVDRNFEEVTLFLRMMDEAMVREPGWVEKTAERLDGILPGRTEELLAVTAQVYVDGQRRIRTASGETTSLEAIRPPVRTASGASEKP
jgi:hypothetical protein